ncbi:MAG: lamin tail domain-containing protein [Myxococcota bacterium]
MRAWIPVTLSILTLGLAAASGLATGCGSSDDCSTNADCPAGRLCRLGLCALDPNQTDGTTTGDTSFVDIPLDCSPATAADLVLNEIMADPPSGADIDQNGIPSTTEDEFVEVVNISSRAVAMTNVQIDIGGKRVVLGSTCLNPNQARVVFGSMGLPSLGNSGATVSLLVDGVVSQSHTYGSEAGHDESITLQPQLDPNGTWVRSGLTWGPAYTPGTCSDTNAFPNCTNNPVVEGDVETVDGETVTPSCTTAPVAGDLIINELMADPGPAIGGNDANGDGVVDGSDDEFVEIVNVSTSTLMLDGAKMADGGGKTFTFPVGSCVAPNQAVLVFGKYTGTGSFGGALTFSGNGLSLNNDGDSVTLRASDATTILAQVAYGAEAGSDQSITRQIDLDPTATLVKHSLAPSSGGTKMSPGFCQSGGAFPDCGAPPADTTDVVESTGEVVDDTTVPVDTTIVDDTTVDDTTVPVDTGPDCGPVAVAADLVINEALLDPPSGFDSNGDGTADTTQDEFVEIINIGTGAVKLDGLKVWDALAAKYSFPAGVCLQVHDAIVVFGKGAQKFDAVGKSDVDTATHGLDLNNSGDTVAIKDGAGAVVITETFGSTSDQSFTRSPDLTGGFVAHKTANNALAASPGKCLNGTALPGCLPQ